MKVLLQVVSRAEVEVDGISIAKIDKGLLLFVGFGKEDGPSKLGSMIDKLLKLRILPDLKGRFNLSVVDAKGAVLVVPQFTLCADVNSGRRPDFGGAMEPQKARELFNGFVAQMKELLTDELKPLVQQGQFGAHMKVSLLNDGPVTIMLEN